MEMAVASKSKQRSIITYKSYLFKDKDPVIDELRTMVQESGDSYTDLHDSSGVSTNTLYNWFKGETRRPQFATVMAVTRALGYDLRFVQIDNSRNASRSVKHRPLQIEHRRSS
jgi:DNA-binding phage protein